MLMYCIKKTKNQGSAKSEILEKKEKRENF
jgi:hypothetical protein